ncbi:MAG: hypothetical protein K1Y36_06930 [Blastocatellia bacterium]|nr:hypothetical protein [Blastocatellia bacterium]
MNDLADKIVGIVPFFCCSGLWQSTRLSNRLGSSHQVADGSLFVFLVA